MVLDRLRDLKAVPESEADLGRDIDAVQRLQKLILTCSPKLSLENKLVNFGAALSKLKGMSDTVNAVLVDLYLTRQQIMLIHLELEEWLDTLIADSLTSKQRGHAAPWLNTLVGRLEGIVDRMEIPSSSGTFTIDSSTIVSSDFQSVSAVLDLSHVLKVRAPKSSVRANLLSKLMRSVLSQWFNLPNDHIRQFQTLLLTSLRDAFGCDNLPGLLLTPSLWDAYCNPRNSIVQRSHRDKTASIHPSQLYNFNIQLLNLPCLRPGTPQSQVYADIREAMHMLQGLNPS